MGISSRGLALPAVYRRPRLVSVHRNFRVRSNKWMLKPEPRKKSRGFLRNDARLREELGTVVIRASDLREGEAAAVELTLKLDREVARANQVKPSR